MTEGRNPVVWIDEGDVVHETRHAILVTNARGAEVWLPKSQLSFYDDGSIGVPEWLAEREEIEGRSHR